MRVRNVVIIGVLAALPHVGSAQTATCRTADVTSGRLVGMVKGMMEPKDSALRRILGVPLVATSQVTLTTDAAVCARAGQALDSLGHALAPNEPPIPPFDDPLYVVKIGSSFAVVDTNALPHGHRYLVFYFGPLWEFKKIGTF